MVIQEILEQRVREEQKKYDDVELALPRIAEKFDLSLNFVRDVLREGDEEPEEEGDDEGGDEGGEEEAAEEDTGPESTGAPAQAPDAAVGQPQGQGNQPALEDVSKTPVADGAIPVDNSGIQSYDPLNPIGEADLNFQQGNFMTIIGLPKLVTDKTNMVTKTFLPLIEVALIELLGNSAQYERQIANITPSFNENGELYVTGTLQYFVRDWVGLDIQPDAISHDANYIIDRLKPSGATVSKCEINVSDGTLIIQFNI